MVICNAYGVLHVHGVVCSNILEHYHIQWPCTCTYMCVLYAAIPWSLNHEIFTNSHPPHTCTCTWRVGHRIVHVHVHVCGRMEFASVYSTVGCGQRAKTKPVLAYSMTRLNAFHVAIMLTANCLSSIYYEYRVPLIWYYDATIAFLCLFNHFKDRYEARQSDTIAIKVCAR